MNQAKTEGEVDLLARHLKRDEEARRALSANPRGWPYQVALAAAFAVGMGLGQAWLGLPGLAGLALSVLCMAVAVLGLELSVANRRINAIVRLLRLPTDP